MFSWRVLPGVPTYGPAAALTVPSLATAGIRVAFTGRAGGVGHADLNLSLLSGDDPDRVAGNRARTLAAVGRSADAWCSGRQVHGTRVAHVGAADAGRGAADPASAVPDTDALWTDAPGVVLAVLTADCVPVFLADPARRRIAVVHAGWRGLVGGIIEASVQAIGPSRDLRAYIGPSIGPCCYEVGEDVAAPAVAAFGDAVVRDGHLDLWRGARIALARAGCNAVTPSLACTRCAPHRYFSHRAGDVGRQALVATLTDG